MLSFPFGGLIPSVRSARPPAPVRRVALYAREAPGRGSLPRLERRISRLAAQVSRTRGWKPVATYADQSLDPPWHRPGCWQLLADAPWAFDVVVVDGYGQLASDRHDLQGVLAQLAAGGTSVAVVPSTRRRLARLVADLALADLVVEAAR